jgi:hypothetical protein
MFTFYVEKQRLALDYWMSFEIFFDLFYKLFEYHRSVFPIVLYVLAPVKRVMRRDVKRILILAGYQEYKI